MGSINVPRRKASGPWYTKLQERRRILQTWFLLYRATRKCTHCAIAHPAVLDFHHPDPKRKGVEISKLASRGVSLDRLLAELSTCVVLCANCHRILHYQLRINNSNDLLRKPNALDGRLPTWEEAKAHLATLDALAGGEIDLYS